MYPRPGNTKFPGHRQGHTQHVRAHAHTHTPLCTHTYTAAQLGRRAGQGARDDKEETVLSCVMSFQAPGGRRQAPPPKRNS